jgi:hypothetical protein
VSARGTPKLLSLKAVLYNTFPGALEEEANNKNLQPCHGHNQARLHQTEVEYSLFGTLDSAEVAVLARAKVLLVTRDSRELCGKLENGFFKDRGLFGGGALLGGNLGTGGFVLNL